MGLGERLLNITIGGAGDFHGDIGRHDPALGDFTPDYIAAICYLLEHGEERLLAAVTR